MAGRRKSSAASRRKNPDVCAHEWVWMGSGALRLEDGSVATRADKGGQPFEASWKWLKLHAKYLGAQLLTVEQYAARHGKPSKRVLSITAEG